MIGSSVAGIGELPEDEFEIDEDGGTEACKHADDTSTARPSADEPCLRQTSSPEDIRSASGCSIGDDSERRRHGDESPASDASTAGGAQLASASDQRASGSSSNGGGCDSCDGAGATVVGGKEYSANGGEPAQQVAVSGETDLRTRSGPTPA